MALADETAVRRTAATKAHRTMLWLLENIVTSGRKVVGLRKGAEGCAAAAAEGRQIKDRRVTLLVAQPM